jgi:hypothetical protein
MTFLELDFSLTDCKLCYGKLAIGRLIQSLSNGSPNNDLRWRQAASDGMERRLLSGDAAVSCEKD